MITTLLIGLVLGAAVVLVLGLLFRRRAQDVSVGAAPAAPKIVAAPPRPASSSGGDLEQLWSLHQKGALTAEEFAAAKARVLDGRANGAADGLYLAVLTACGDNKIAAIKEVRAVTGLGLKEAKDAVEGPPFILGQGLTADEAARIQSDFAAVGATVELR